MSEQQNCVGHDQFTKPHGGLSDTNWLTNAVDAERGMRLVVYDSGEQHSERIVETYLENGEKWIKTNTGDVYASARINHSERMVIE